MKRHRQDTATYRELRNYKERVQSFNGTVRNLYEYVRVQLDVDRAARSRDRIINARVATLTKLIDRLHCMV